MFKNSLTISDLLDRARKVQGLDSDRKLSKALGYHGPHVAKMRNQDALPSPEKMLLLADMIDMDHMEALTWLNLWEAKKRQEPAVAGIWEQALKAMDKASKKAAMWGILLAFILAPPVDAKEHGVNKSQQVSAKVYIMR